jgi:hypothetical protein
MIFPTDIPPRIIRGRITIIDKTTLLKKCNMTASPISTNLPNIDLEKKATKANRYPRKK